MARKALPLPALLALLGAEGAAEVEVALRALPAVTLTAVRPFRPP